MYHCCFIKLCSLVSNKNGRIKKLIKKSLEKKTIEFFDIIEISLNEQVASEFCHLERNLESARLHLSNVSIAYGVNLRKFYKQFTPNILKTIANLLSVSSKKDVIPQPFSKIYQNIAYIS